MRRILTVVVSSLLGFSAPAFSQTVAPTGQGVTQQNSQASSDGLTAFGQEPPPNDNTTALLIGGGVLIGGAALIAIVVNSNRNNDTTTPPPASP